MGQSDFRITFLHRLAGFVGAGYLHLVGRTSIVENWDHPGFLAFRRLKNPIIYAFWHNNQAFLAWAHRGEGVHIMVSQSKDGEFIAQVMKRLGLNAVRGSSSRGAEGAFRQMCAVLEKGEQAGFTPDGPRGPVQRVHGGVIAAAQISGAPIVPVAMSSRRKIVFNSWDKFVLPLPFSHVVVAHGKPLWVSKDENPIAAAERLRQALNAAVADGEESLRRAPGWWTSFGGWLLNLLYTVLISIFGPLSLLIFMVKHGAKRTFNHLGERFNPGGIRGGSELRLWLHAASVGEWQALRPVLACLQEAGDMSFVVTVSTPEARALVSREQPDIPVRMMPLDLPFVVNRWIRRIRPDAAAIVETELWPNVIRGLRRAMVPTFIINGRLSAGSAGGWRFVKPFSQRMLSSVSRLLVRTDIDGRRYCSIGAPVARVTVTGNTKIDNLRVLTAEERQARRSGFFGPTPEDQVIVVAGSTWPGEEQIMLDILAARGGRKIRLVLAPRRATRFEEVAKLLAGVPFTWSAWSRAKAERSWTTDILLVDTLGDLKDLYGAGDMAFVGGSLVPHGGQNPLEPAAAGIPVLFGPSMENFHEEAEDLKRAGGARQVRHHNDLSMDILDLAADRNLRQTCGDAAARFVRARQGAARQTAEVLRSSLLLEIHRG